MNNRIAVKGQYRDQYFNDYFDYLKQRLDSELASAGKKTLAEATIRTKATDTFFLEKKDDREFGYWIQNEQTMQEAEKCLARYLSGRSNPQSDLKYYMQDMQMFKDYMEARQNKQHQEGRLDG